MRIASPETALEKAACRLGVITVAVVWTLIGLSVASVRFQWLSFETLKLVMVVLAVFSLCVAMLLIMVDLEYYRRHGKNK